MLHAKYHYALVHAEQSNRAQVLDAQTLGEENRDGCTKDDFCLSCLWNQERVGKDWEQSG